MASNSNAVKTTIERQPTQLPKITQVIAISKNTINVVKRTVWNQQASIQEEGEQDR